MKQISITYYSKDYDSAHTFNDITVFKTFINECHKDLTTQEYDKFITYYNNIRAESNKDKTIYVTINGDKIYFTQFYLGIKEIIEKIKLTQKLITNELITIINCNAWKYDTTYNNDGTANINVIYYTIDQNNPNNNLCQIHIYKNLIICYSQNNTKPHLIKNNNCNVRFTDKL